MCTWLEGDLAEQHPGISKIELALDGTGHVISQVDDDEAGSRILLIRRWAEGEWRGLPVRVRAEVTNHLTEGFDVSREHVVAVDLSGEKATRWDVWSWTVMENFSFSDHEPHLHRGKVSYAVKLKHYFYKSTREALIVPAHVVISWPSIAFMTYCKIVQATHSISQLAQALCHTEKQRGRACLMLRS